MHAAVESRAGSSGLWLLGANLVTIVLALYEGWDLTELMLIYWAQSVIIGYYNFRRILDLKRFSTENFELNGSRPPETVQTKRKTAAFFALHYGIFHVAYLSYLIGGEQQFRGSWLMLIVCTAVFYLNHKYSYFHYRDQDQNRKPNIGVIMFFPYVRIVPMHLTIVLGNAAGPTTSSSLLLFLVLKTAADVAMHLIEHRRWRPNNGVEPHF